MVRRFKYLSEREDTRPLIVELPARLFQRLKALSTQTHLTMRSYVINFIEHGLAREEADVDTGKTEDRG
jgi:predicted DNA-binding protein